MERLFGIPLDALSVVLLALVAASFGVIAVLAVRNRVFLRLGVRNVRRRKARTALIVVGLMLATAIISSALGTGDTMGTTIRSTVVQSLGEIDELVAVEGAEVDPTLVVDAAAANTYFDEARFDDVAAAVEGSSLVDGVAPAIIEPVAVQDITSRETEPRVTLFGSDPEFLEGFGDMRAGGAVVSLADLAPGEAFVNEDAAEEMSAAAGHTLTVFAGERPTQLTVRDVVSFRGSGADGPSLLVSLEQAQSIVGRPGEVTHVMVSNAGTATSGVGYTPDVVDLLDPALAPIGLEAQPVKQNGLDLADEQGNAFLTLFSVFGSFAVAAGILLVFLIFVMLAAERRGEMGIARAVGTQRGHLVQTFVFEGAVYDVIAAAVGALLGVGVSFAMVQGIAAAFATEGLDIVYGFRFQSLAVAYGLGVILTLVVVAVSAWRVSVLDIVTAIRNLPTPVVQRTRRSRWVRGLLLVAVGSVMTAAGAASAQGTPFFLGVSIVIAGLVPVARALGASDRVAYTLGGTLLVVWWLLPYDLFEPLLGDMGMDFSIWVAAGIMVVLGATWAVMNNADAILQGLTRALRRVRSLAPVLRMAVAYPLRARARTGMTLAMFMLVVVTLVTGTTISGSFIKSFDDIESFGGGFDVRAVSTPVRPIDDMEVAIRESKALRPGSVLAVGEQSFVPVEVRQAGTDGAFADYPVRGVNDVFLTETTFGIAAMAEGFESADEVWDAIEDEPGLAVVDTMVAPHRSSFAAGAMPDFQIEGFYVEDGTFSPVPVEVRDPATGEVIDLTVIGVLRDDAPFQMAGITTSQDVLAPLGERALPTTHLIKLNTVVDATEAARDLESGLLQYGVEAEAMSDLLDEAVGASYTVNRLIQGFMGLGLVVGVVALGVISARAVVERRQQIGVLRAIGFQPSMVRLSFLIEASFVSLTAIVLGATVGLIMSFNVVSYAGRTQDVAFSVPWLNLGVIFGVVYLAALASTLLPALRGSRVYPAEALRYQ